MRACDCGTGLTGISLDRVGSVPVYRQLYASVREAVLAGRLPPGARLPSARSLAAQLAVARGTVEAAYHLLAGEGFIVGRGASGTVVDPGLTIGAAQPSALPRPVADERLPQRGVPPAPFALGLPALDAFPRKTWTRLATRAARSLGEAAMTYQHPAGLEALGRAIAAHLAVARGIACHPGQVLVTNGFQGALGLVTRVLMRPGERAWIEDPGFHLAREALVLAGLEPVPVPVDGDGLDVAAGCRLGPEARVAGVPPTPPLPPRRPPHPPVPDRPPPAARPPPRPAALGRGGRGLDRRGRLRQRVPLPRPPAAGAEGPGCDRPRPLRRDVQQDPLPGPAARLPRRAGRARPAAHPRRAAAPAGRERA